MRLSAPVPILRSFSEDKAHEFYVEFLGFQVEWEHRFEPDTPLYMEVKRDGVVLHLSEHHGDAAPGATIVVPVDDIEALHAELSAKHYRYARPGIVDQPWAREMTIADPFGNRIRFHAPPRA